MVISRVILKMFCNQNGWSRVPEESRMAPYPIFQIQKVEVGSGKGVKQVGMRNTLWIRALAASKPVDVFQHYNDRSRANWLKRTSGHSLTYSLYP